MGSAQSYGSAPTRIIDETIWQRVQERLEAVSRRYTRHADGSPKGRAIPGRATTHLLSGLLVCGVCSGAMVVYGGGQGSRHYRCSDQVKRGTCKNRLGIREDVAKHRVLDALRAKLASPEGVAYVRRRVAERLGEMERTRSADLDDLLKRHSRTQGRIRGLVGFIADGDRSEAVVLGLKDLEAQAKAEKAAIADLEDQAREPIRLPAPDEVVERVFELERLFEHDPTARREALARYFKDGQIRLEPQADGIYLAKSELLPLVILLEEAASPPPPASRRRRYTARVAGAGFEPTTFGL
jgi:hypothetical protein